MNLVGKIFVVLILVMSLVFMAFAVTVFATHKSWRQVVENPRPATASSNPPLGLKFQLEDERAKVIELTNQLKNLTADRDNERAARERAVAKLTTEVQQLDAEKTRLTKAEQDLTEKVRDAVAAMDATQNTLKVLRGEVDVLRTDVAKARKERDDALASSVKLQDQVAQAKGELERLKPRTEVLAAQVRKFELLVQDRQLQTDRNVPRVQGEVLASHESGRVEVSVGFDDGLEKGQTMSVYRYGPTADTSKYLGEIRIVRTEADRAVGEIVPGTKRGAIQVKDRVNTRLN